MLVSDRKDVVYGHSATGGRENPCSVWKEKTFRPPKATKRGFRWKASTLRALRRWSHPVTPVEPVTIIVPALYSVRPGEALAMGWLNEIDTLTTIRQRMIAAAKATGWDVFTFHTLHNLDRFYDSTIAAVRETWTREGSLSAEAVAETGRQFSNALDYHRIQPRLVENLVFQSSLMEWLARRAEDIPVRYHVIGTALYSALIWSGSISFIDAVNSAIKVGNRWDNAICEKTTSARERFDLIERLMAGRERLSLAVSGGDLPKPGPLSRSFWFSATPGGYPTLIETPRDAMLALESFNLMSWSNAGFETAAPAVQGWLATPLHPVSRLCKHSVANYLLASPDSVTLFLDNIAGIGQAPVLSLNPDVQNRLRLSRIKVTGP